MHRHILPIHGTLLVAVSICAAAPQEPDSEQREQARMQMMEARFELQGAFDRDRNTAVSLTDLHLPEPIRKEFSARFDPDKDGVVTFEEYESAMQRGSRPSSPRDRSDFTSLKAGGYPINAEPEIISASESEIGDEDMVMGVILNGEPRAYPVNYMNGPNNEVVNDELGGQAIAPSW